MPTLRPREVTTIVFDQPDHPCFRRTGIWWNKDTLRYEFRHSAYFSSSDRILLINYCPVCGEDLQYERGSV